MRINQKITYFILIIALLFTGCVNLRQETRALKTFLVDIPLLIDLPLKSDLPEEIYVSPKNNPYRNARVGVFRFKEPSYARGTGENAAEALFNDLLNKEVFAYVSYEASETYAGMASHMEQARRRGYDLIITGNVRHYFDGSDYVASNVNEQINVVDVPTGRILWSATAKSKDAPLPSADYLLFQRKGVPAKPTSALIRRNAAKFSNMLLKLPKQAELAKDCKRQMLSSRRDAFEDLQNQVNDLLAQNNLMGQQLSKEVEYGKTLKVEVDTLSDQADQLELQLKEEIDKGEITLKRHKSKTIINIDNRICFDSGSAVLKKGIRRSLTKISKTLKKFPDNYVQIEGHTDNVPIRSRQYPSNWELSSARSLSVLRFLLDNSKIDPGKLSAAGYGEHHPVGPNDSAKNRRLNRRVDIVIEPTDT